MQLLFYTKENGRSPVIEEIDSLPVQASATVYELLDGIEKNGFNAVRVEFRQLEGKLWEIKMRLPQSGAYRIFYGMVRKDTMMLLHAYKKQTQKAPTRELQTALNRLSDCIRRGL
jgi:phage-related protein